MHEFSLVIALLDQIRAHLPEAGVLRGVKVRAGAAQAIEPDAMDMAWYAATQASEFQGARLDLEITPWELTCEACGRQWQGADPLEVCECGSPAQPRGDADLTLVSLEVDLPDETDIGERT